MGPVSAPPLLPLLTHPTPGPAAPAPDLQEGALVELLQPDGTWRKGWKVVDVVASSIGTRYRLESGTDYRVVGPAQVRRCGSQQVAACWLAPTAAAGLHQAHAGRSTPANNWLS